MSASTTASQGPFLTISMNANAMKMAEAVWSDRFNGEEVAQWHLDLQRFAAGTFPSPENLRAARDEAFRFLNERNARGMQARAEIFARAKLSFMTWLGWEMRFSPHVAAHNFYSGAFSRFEQPNLVRFEMNQIYRWLKPDPALAPQTRRRTGSSDAVVIIDLFGKSTHEQLGSFVHSQGGPPVKTKNAYRLIAPPGEVLQPDFLHDVLQDAIQLIGELRSVRGVKRIHLGLAVPDVVAFFLGKQLNAQGVEILLYEFYNDDGGEYRFVFPLDRNVA